MTELRLILIGIGIVAFAYSVRTGADWPRWVAIGCLLLALAVRWVLKIRRSRAGKL